MSTNATSLTASIKARAASVLGATYSELAYTNSMTKNSFKGNFKRYGVLSKGATEVNSVTRYTTLDQTFELILADSFINAAMSDAAEAAKGPALQDLAYDIYRDLCNTKAGSPSTVLLVSGLSISTPETLEQDHVVVIRAEFTVRYRVAI